MVEKKKRLGRGLGSLIGNVKQVTEVSEEEMASGLRMLPIDKIQRGEYQPRKHFDEESLQELANSITAQGVIQPIVVRLEGSHYELIAGERRWRAAQLAGLQSIPAVIRQIDTQSAAAIALIENIQREDLNPLEESAALQRLIDDFQLTHMQVAEAVGRSRVAVSNLLRLLELAEPVKDMVNKSLLSMGHARAILALPTVDQPEIARLVVNRALSVRETEALVKKALSPQAKKPLKAPVDPDIQRLEQRISDSLCTEVKIKTGHKGAGQLVINFHSNDELDGILQHFMGSN
ncbi:MAG: ParB/RepB/Spo0J family partition protein [Gammaproteobacteria bacterium]|nr:ParB/RepB/Spo0J family partition protein [Gammaproteobacteria bacterium]MBL6998616.1 ParB/RepB/Spo0J family partition protein [Gammaproteobacteria bacterium]